MGAALQARPTGRRVRGAIAGTGVLFAHKVSQAQCQDRQRGRYHKCFTCAYNNAYVAVHGLPAVEATAEVPASDREDPAKAVKVG